MEVHVNPPVSLLLIVYPKQRIRQLYIFPRSFLQNETREPRPDQDSPAPSCAVLRLQPARPRSQSPPEWFVRTSSRRLLPLPCPGNSCIRHGTRDRSARPGLCHTAPCSHATPRRDTSRLTS